MKKKIPYGIANYTELVEKNCYFVDKTKYIETLETVNNPVFLRPRKFGKSLLCQMLECYYSLNQQDNFEYLFGNTYIGQHPTPYRNSFLVLPLDFSVIDPSGTIPEIETSFNHHCNTIMNAMVEQAEQWFQQRVKIDFEQSASANLMSVLGTIKAYHLPKLYTIIDEYDNFANQLVTANKDHLYHELTAEDSFMKPFFKVLKEGRKDGTVANVFITGVLPITLDDMASGFNIANFITLRPDFEAMLGFTQSEVDKLLDDIYRDYEIDPSTRKEVDAIIKNHYNGYHFSNTKGESLYNSTILMYFLDWFCCFKKIPETLTDLNLKTDISWVRRLTGANPANTDEFVDRLTTQNNIPYDRILVAKFNMSQFFEKSFYPISFFYLGMLTRQDMFSLRLPNLNMRQIFVEYFNELHHIDVSTKYLEMMQGFINRPDLFKLFADYWQLYVSQLPESIFQQMNENFYRTTFFELCSRHLSPWFTWNVERSYPQGKSDLEFVGKYHEQFAGLRWVIEFKYYSAAEFKRKFKKVSLKDFKVQVEDTQQIGGYVEGLREEYPEANIRQFVIYCIGHQGFRVFEVI